MASPTFSGTVVGGIQDVSALLPLLGTEQCEQHIGSALERGFLYSSITPISIFGSLGIVRASFNILIANLNVSYFRFLGAKKLNDCGFNLAGVVAPMIALDPLYPRRFLAESRLEAMLTDEHIKNVEYLTVSWGKKMLWWNFMLVSLSLVFATAGLLPYILIIHNSQHSLLARGGSFNQLSSGWGFPVIRILGSALCVIAAQLLMQQRVLVLLKTRLLFIGIDRQAKEAKINLQGDIQTRIESGTRHEQKQYWSDDVSSEMCIWSLRRWLASQDPESLDHRQFVQKIYDSEYTRQLGPMNVFVPVWLTSALSFALVIGIALTVGGYIGCFYLIQHSTNGTFGPVVWLILEAFLSVIRILVWAFNPSWDDPEGIVFQFQLATHPPLLTCDTHFEEIKHGIPARVTRASDFLEDIVPYTGPLPPFSANDFGLYYIFAAAGDDPPSQPGNQKSSSKLEAVLCVVVFAHKQQKSWILYKEDVNSSFLVYISTLEHVARSTAINIKVDSPEAVKEAESPFLAADIRLRVMDQLESQYNVILSRLQNRESNRGSLTKTWMMQRPGGKKMDMLIWEVDAKLEADMPARQTGANLEADMPDRESDVKFEVKKRCITLTKEDIAYLSQGQVDRRGIYMLQQLGKWIEIYIGLFTKELLQDMLVDLVFEDESSLLQKHEAIEAEYLLIKCWTSMEWLLMETATMWDREIQVCHRQMTVSVVQGTFYAAKEELDPVQLGEGFKQGKLKARLVKDKESLLDRVWSLHMDNMHQRLRTQVEPTRRKTQESIYNDVTDESILTTWSKILTQIEDILRSSLHHSAKRVLLSAEMKFHTRHFPKFEDTLRSRAKSVRDKLYQIENEMTREHYLNQFRRILGRCRDRADWVLTSMNHQTTEFKELQDDSVLTDPNDDRLLSYWRTESLQERRRLLDTGQKYLLLSDSSVKAVGGPENMVQALQRSQDFTYIDVSKSKLLTVADILLVLKSVKSIRGVSSNLEKTAKREILNAVMANVDEAVNAKLEDTCLYENATVTDSHRKGRPYLLFRLKMAGHPISRCCTVIFHAREKRDHIITLRHCVGNEGSKIDIKLNDHHLECTVGLSQMQRQMVKLNFIDEDIMLPADCLNVEKANTLIVSLVEGTYALSDVFFPICAVHGQVSGDDSANPLSAQP